MSFHAGPVMAAMSNSKVDCGWWKFVINPLIMRNLYPGAIRICVWVISRLVLFSVIHLVSYSWIPSG